MNTFTCPGCGTPNRRLVDVTVGDGPTYRLCYDCVEERWPSWRETASIAVADYQGTEQPAPTTPTQETPRQKMSGYRGTCDDCHRDREVFPTDRYSHHRSNAEPRRLRYCRECLDKLGIVLRQDGPGSIEPPSPEAPRGAALTCPMCQGTVSHLQKVRERGAKYPALMCDSCFEGPAGRRIRHLEYMGVVRDRGPGAAAAQQAEALSRDKADAAQVWADERFGTGTPSQPNAADPWAHRSANMRCRTCMWYVPKAASQDRAPAMGLLGPVAIGRCRRHAPTMNGFPVVYPTDWCGDHKLDETKL